MSRTRLAKAPYDRYGGLVSYIVSNASNVHEWRENTPFPEMLLLTGTTRGMSAARFTWSASGGRTFEMFMTDAVDLLTNATNIFKGSVDTWWIAQKRGKNYGIRLATQKDLKHAGHTSGPYTDCPACQAAPKRWSTGWCPLDPTDDTEHQAQPSPYLMDTCRCGTKVHHHIHGTAPRPSEETP
ncbi:hypothetical protein E6R60_26375 [Streptomyces sp. A0642]|uniref:hypothetical protein n=1 Tax=Streptomyces sp. A0642 TaxID=2563100 RepID=UPI0010A2340B|nr:hypothetical protein [Streptomyces sp. A0642]THA72460.1 hypothetical protein E6R60_26375 [Streptomyces sp. A0642]